MCQKLYEVKVAKIILNEDHERLQNPRIVDLSKQSELSIESLLDSQTQEFLRSKLSIE